MNNMERDKNYRTPQGEWTSPLLDVPDQDECVAIICDVVPPNNDGKLVRIKQTAIYQQVDGREVWHCVHPFVLLRWWMRFPAEPQDKIIPMHGELKGGRA